MYRPIPGWKPSLMEVVGDEFENLLATQLTVAIHFWAVFSGYSPPMEVSILAIQKRFDGRVLFVACDVGREENAGLCKQFGVATVPVMVIVPFRGQRRAVVGYREPEALARAVEYAIKPGFHPWWRFWKRG